MTTQQEFRESVGQVVGKAEYHGIHLHLVPAPTVNRRRKPSAPTDAGVHAQWLQDHEDDQLFIEKTRIAATRPERLLLQRLIHEGARHEHVRELWQLGLLRVVDGKLVLRNKAYLPWLAAGSFVAFTGLASPLAAISLSAPESSALWLVPFLFFAGATAYATWCCRQFLRPWRYAKRYKPVVDELNQRLRPRRTGR